VPAALAEARQAGIQIAMITGDLYRHALSVTQVGDSQSRGSVNQWRP
jgi:magnesium-transporting ATPase (P-type)